MHTRPPGHDLALLLEFRSPATYSAVAQRLGVAHTTVSRKVRELESYFGTPLLERYGDALALTVDGAKAVAAAERMSSELAALDRGISARDERLAGSVKLTTVDILATRYMPVLSSFALSHPGIEVTLDTDPSLRSLSRRDADVALRLTNRPDDLLSGVLLEKLEFFAYDRVDAGKDVELPTLRWLDYGNHECAARAEHWMQTHANGVRPQAYVSTPLMMLHAVRNGLGAGMLPASIADKQVDLRRVSDIPAFSMDVWLLAAKELRRTARVRALFEAFRRGPVQ